jgi:flagellar protein FlaI
MFDWLWGAKKQAVAPPPPAPREEPRSGKRKSPKEPFTERAGVAVYAGSGEHGTYAIDDEITAQGGRAVLDFVLGDDMLEEVMHNGSHMPLVVYHRSHGMCDVNYKLEPPVVDAYIRELAEYNEKELNDRHPFLDGTLPDGSRLNVAIPPVSGRFPTITIRKFKETMITVPDIVRGGGMSADAAAFLWCAMEGFGHSAANMLVVGGTGSGKTTTLNAVSQFAQMHHRIVVIEDARELKITQPNALRMGVSETVSMDDLLVNALRQRPDRIIVGEVRGPEARTLFTAMNTGHDGCLGTLHANSARECLNRITSPPMAVPLSQVVGLDLVMVQTKKNTADGALRFCKEISEVSGFSGDTARLNQLFVWDEFEKRLTSTGIPSRLRTKICNAAGITADQFQDTLRRRTALLQQLADRRVDEKEYLDVLAEEHSKSK